MTSEEVPGGISEGFRDISDGWGGNSAEGWGGVRLKRIDPG